MRALFADSGEYADSHTNISAGTPNDLGTPIDLQWFKVKQSNLVTVLANVPDERQPIETYLICSTCITNVNDCLNLGVCDEATGNCTCQFGFSGALCELAAGCFDVGCRADGVCDFDTGICSCPEGFSGDLCEVNATSGRN